MLSPISVGPEDALPASSTQSLKALREWRQRHSPGSPPAISFHAAASADEQSGSAGALGTEAELARFDPAELPNDQVVNTSKHIPLIGALLISEGLITREQLNASLLIQAQDHPDMPVGEILVRCGYVSAAALDRMLALQHDMKSSLVRAVETQATPSADLTALLLHERGSELAYSVLNQLGVAATSVRNRKDLHAAQQEAQFDMILLGTDLLDEMSSLPVPESTPLLILPPIARSHGYNSQFPQWTKSLIARFVGQVREQRQQRDMAERLNQREYELSVVAAMGRDLTSARSTRDALVRLMMTVRDLFGVEAGTLYRFARDTDELIFEIVLGPHQEQLYQKRLPIDRGLAGWVVRNGEPLLIPDARRDPRFEGLFDNQSGFQTRSVLCVPLIARGEVRGVIQLINKLSGAFNERDLQLLRILATMGGLAEVAEAWLYDQHLAS